MLNLVKNNRQSYLETIMSNLEDYSYRNKRYRVNFAIAIGLCKENVDFSKFIKDKRKTDKLIVLEDNLCCTIFDCANSEPAIKATSNMIDEFHNNNFGKEIYVSIVASEDYEGDKNMINSLFDILEYSVDNNIHDVVLDRKHIETSNA